MTKDSDLRSAKEEEIAEIFSQATQVFESEERAHQWLESPVDVLGHQKPSELLRTSDGRRLLSAVLRKLECGDFS